MVSSLPCSFSTVAPMALLYFVPSWKMWPTSMPRAIDSVPLPSGLASPSTTLRRSAQSGAGKSRSQLTPVRCLPSSLAPQTKSASCAALWSTMTGIDRPAGPSEPALQPAAVRICSSDANCRGVAMASSFSALTVLRSWSPRSTSATVAVSLPCSSSVFTHCSGLTPRCLQTSSILCCPGVSTVLMAAVAAGLSTAGAMASARSTLAAYSPPDEKAMASSPESAST